jgi:hypothetical protein
MFDIVFIASSYVIAQGTELNCEIYPEVHVGLVGLLNCMNVAFPRVVM